MAKEKEFKIIKDSENHKKGDTIILTEELEAIFKKAGHIAGGKKEKV